MRLFTFMYLHENLSGSTVIKLQDNHAERQKWHKLKIQQAWGKTYIVYSQVSLKSASDY